MSGLAANKSCSKWATTESLRQGRRALLGSLAGIFRSKIDDSMSGLAVVLGVVINRLNGGVY
jgi:hypothetical protein